MANETSCFHHVSSLILGFIKKPNLFSVSQPWVPASLDLHGTMQDAQRLLVFFLRIASFDRTSLAKPISRIASSSFGRSHNMCAMVKIRHVHGRKLDGCVGKLKNNDKIPTRERMSKAPRPIHSCRTEGAVHLGVSQKKGPPSVRARLLAEVLGPESSDQRRSSLAAPKGCLVRPGVDPWTLYGRLQRTLDKHDAKESHDRLWACL